MTAEKNFNKNRILFETVIMNTSAASVVSNISPATSIVASNNNIALQLYQEVGKQNENVIICPISLNILLALILVGAKNETAEEIQNVLKLTNENFPEDYQNLLLRLNKGKDNFTLNIINKIYIDDSFTILDSYSKIAKTSFNTEVENAALLNSPNETLTEINKWIETKTNGTIKNVLKELTEDDVMVLLNTVYFAAHWEKEFQLTKHPLQFQVNKDTIVEVPDLFRRDHFEYFEDEDLKIQVLKIPYVDTSYNMVILLPNRDVELSDVEEKLLEQISSNYYGGKVEKQLVKVSIPMFKVEQTHQLTSILQKLGIESAFGDDADLSGLSETNEVPLKIGDVLQRAFIEVTEKGTVASAATPGMVAMKLSMTQIFNADRPFIFFIQDDRSNIILHLGRYRYPTIFYQH